MTSIAICDGEVRQLQRWTIGEKTNHKDQKPTKIQIKYDYVYTRFVHQEDIAIIM